jgi:hypothetical protein
MIALFTDFGVAGPYLGQVKVVLMRELGMHPVIELMSDAPVHNPKAASYILVAITSSLPKGAVTIAVVDPGVGSSLREGVVIEADGKYFVGPGNGLFGVIQQTARSVKISKINWCPKQVSATFHGRDIFAPIAAKIIKNDLHANDLSPLDFDMPILGPADLAEVVYVDHFGNLMTGVRGEIINKDKCISINGYLLAYASTFASVCPGEGFWYVNSSGLVEIAVNCARANDRYRSEIGQSIEII